MQPSNTAPGVDPRGRCCLHVRVEPRAPSNRRTLVTGRVVILVAIVLAGCSSSSSHNGSAPTPTTLRPAISGGSCTGCTLPPTTRPASTSSSSSCLTTISGGSAARTPGISGTLRMVGGPPPGMDRPVAGAVTVTSATTECGLDVGADGSFELTVPVGTYTVTGRSPSFGGSRYECSGGTVKVTSAGETPVTVVCAVP